jgi:hypothetical protein
MKAKINRGNGFRGVLEYAFGPGKHNKLDRAEIVGGNLDGMNPRELAAEFSVSRRQRPEVKNPVWHCSLSLPKGERLDSIKGHQICERYLQLMEIDTDNHMWVAVRHDDTDYDHVHIVLSRIGLDAKLWHGRNDVKAAIQSTQELEREFGLRITPGFDDEAAAAKREHRGEREKRNRAGRTSLKERMQTILNKAIQTVGFDAFVEACQTAGLELLPNVASTGKMNGFSFRLDGEIMKASDLGSKYKWAKLAKTTGFDPSQHMPMIHALVVAMKKRKESEPEATLCATKTAEPKSEKSRNRTIDLLFIRLEGGTYAWKKNLSPAFFDLGHRIRFDRAPDVAVKAALQLAREKGWTEVAATGSIDFRRRAWLQGQILNVKVTGYVPTTDDFLLLAERRCDLAIRNAQKEKDPLIRQILIVKARAEEEFAAHRAKYGEIPSTEIADDTIQVDQRNFVENHADEEYHQIKKRASASWAILKKSQATGFLSKLLNSSMILVKTENELDWTTYLVHCRRIIATASADRTRLGLVVGELSHFLRECRAKRMPTELQDAIEGKVSAKPHIEAVTKVVRQDRHDTQSTQINYVDRSHPESHGHDHSPTSESERSSHRL